MSAVRRVYSGTIAPLDSCRMTHLFFAVHYSVIASLCSTLNTLPIGTLNDRLSKRLIKIEEDNEWYMMSKNCAFLDYCYLLVFCEHYSLCLVVFCSSLNNSLSFMFGSGCEIF